MSMYHFSDTEAVEHDVNTVPDSGDFERVEIDGQWYVPERACHDTSRSEFFKCSECGHSVEVEYSDSRLYDRGCLADDFDYCPYCGARVVGKQ